VPRVELALLLACLAAVVGIRLQLLASTDFPINDGGLFLAFLVAVARVFPGIPDIVQYNGLSIPFAYPPLSFWLCAAAVRLGAEPLQIIHRVPILMNIVFVLLFTLLLRRTGHSRLFTAVAVLVFGTTFRSYEWLVMGGGLSRGLGSLFLLLSLLALTQRSDRQTAPFGLPRLITAGICAGAAMLSHLEWGMLSAFSVAVWLALPRPRLRDYARALITVGVTAVATVVPWFWSVYATHGLAPFVAASGTSYWGVNMMRESARAIGRTSTFLLPFVLFGVVTASRTRDVFWVVFLVACLVLIPRSGETPMVLAVGVLAASGFLSLLLLLQRWRAPARRPVLAGVVLIGCVLTGMRVLEAMRRDENFAALPPESRSAMAWVAGKHPGARFAVLKEAPWNYNAAAEWFPVLTHAVNTTTVQGREWLPGRDFGRAYLAVEEHLNVSTSCDLLLRNLDGLVPADFVWVEGVDLAARAAALGAEYRHKTMHERMEAISLSLSGSPPAYRGARHTALRGPGTLANCFDAAGYEEVYSNARVRIFRAPQKRRSGY
jgi:hypothetical protein